MNAILIRALNKLKLLKYFNLIGKIKLNDQVFRIPVRDSTGFFNLFLHDPWMLELLRIIFRGGVDGFIDVGVNIGQTLLKVRSISPDTEYIGFEPNTICINYVNRLIKENDFINTRTIPVGISDRTELGVLKYFSNKDSDESASVISGFRGSEKVIREDYVPLFAGEDLIFLFKSQAISVMKIDVEGAELEVLTSFKSVIEKHQPIIIIEILPAYNNQNIFRIERQKRIQNFFHKLEYSMHSIIKHQNRLIDIKEIKEIEIHSDLNRCEYVMLPGIKREVFQQNFKRNFNQV